MSKVLDFYKNKQELEGLYIDYAIAGYIGGRAVGKSYSIIIYMEEIASEIKEKLKEKEELEASLSVLGGVHGVFFSDSTKNKII